ncbi:MAG: hypothetical protein U0996_08000 [Planctomycetaceae bacterium]
MDKNITQTWTIDASVHYALMLASEKDSIAITAEILRELDSTIDVISVIPMKDCQASVSIPGYAATIMNETGSMRVCVTSPARDTPERDEGELIVAGYAADGSRCEVHWPMVVAWEHDLLLAPEIRELGAIPIGIPTTQDFHITSRSAKELHSLRAAVVELNNCGGEVTVDEQSKRLEVRVTPVEPGRFSMVFSINDQFGLPAAFSASGYGYAKK